MRARDGGRAPDQGCDNGEAQEETRDSGNSALFERSVTRTVTSSSVDEYNSYSCMGGGAMARSPDPPLGVNFLDSIRSGDDEDTTMVLTHSVIKPSITVPFDRYEIVGELGRGGMGAVYLAAERMPSGASRYVALKVIRTDAPDASHLRDMFLAEANLLVELNDPHVVNVCAVNITEGTPYIAMEYVRGITLRNLWEQRREQGGPLPPELAAALLAQACRGLHSVHNIRRADGKLRHVVHRDVTPQNLMCSPDGFIRLIDFGVVDAKDLNVRIEFAGKAAYMAPEQLAGRPATRRSDIFSMGVVLYELLTGERLFDGKDDVERLTAVMRFQYQPPPGVPAPLESILRSTLSREPEARPPTAEDLAVRLEEYVTETSSRLLGTAACAARLRELGVNLDSAQPRPLTEYPSFLPVPVSAFGTINIPSESCVAIYDVGDVEVVLACEILKVGGGGPAVIQVSEAVPELDVVAQRGSIMVSLPDSSKSRLYIDALSPMTHVMTFYIAPGASGTFDVGHRKGSVETLTYISAAPDSSGKAVVRLPDLRVQLVTDSLRQILVLWCRRSPGDAARLICVGVQ